MRIAIIDGINQDIGLKILFPEADYFVVNIQYPDVRNISHSYYNINPIYDWSIIDDTNYDYLFIVIPLYNAKQGTTHFQKDIYDILNRELDIINKNNFKKVFFFDIYDYDYDPNDFIINKKIDLFFKRNYNKTKLYNENVVPFPFIMFGYTSLIEKIDRETISEEYSYQIKQNRIFFTGALFEHNDNEIKHYRNRKIIYDKIQNYIYNPGYLSYKYFLKELRESKFGLDLNGVGEPNKRTFEILSQGTLRISEYNDLKWPFEENFSEETIFKNEYDFVEKINILSSDENIYKKCLDNQMNIYKKYFNIEWIRNYIFLKM